jgi:hypothetical protein
MVKITTLKAMSLGLTNSLVMPGFGNDPHGMFAGGDGDAIKTEAAIAKMLKGFYELASTLKDPASGLVLTDRLLMTITGDTMKQPFARQGWGDGSPGNTNVMYVVGGSARLRSGWHGGFASPQAPMDFNPETGATVARGTAGSVSGAAAFASAAAAVAYAVSGDLRRPADFGRSEFAGLVTSTVV